MKKLRLYDYYRSSASFRVRVALNIKKLDYEIIPVHLLNNGGEQHASEYYSINPQRLVPTLEVDGQYLTQSLAIIDYLEEVRPTPSLYPKDLYLRSLARAFALIIAADTHPVINLRVLKYLGSQFQATDEQRNQWYQHWIAAGLSALEEQLQRHQVSGQYCVGDTLTLPDLCLTPQLFNARRFGCDLTPYPTLLRIDENCQQHEAFVKAWPVEAITG